MTMKKSIDMWRDKCPEDREIHKKLVIEMKAKNEALIGNIDPVTNVQTTNKYVIRNDKIVFVDKDGRPVKSRV